MTHTPGPWYRAEQSEYIREDASDNVLARIENGGHVDPDIILIEADQQEANARLIAAAPDLLEALKDIIDLVPTDCQDDARAAIKKATK